MEGGGETKRHLCACVRRVQRCHRVLSAVHTTHACVRRACAACTRCAALCCAALRVAPRRACRVAHASLGCEPRRLLARKRVTRVRRECVRAVRAEHALGVVWCDACGRRPFSRVGNFARQLSLGEAWTHHTPTLRVDALPPRGASTRISCTTVRCDFSSTNHSRGGEPPKIPGLHCSAQSA